MALAYHTSAAAFAVFKQPHAYQHSAAAAENKRGIGARGGASDIRRRMAGVAS